MATSFVSFANSVGKVPVYPLRLNATNSRSVNKPISLGKGPNGMSKVYFMATVYVREETGCVTYYLIEQKAQ